MRDWKKWKEVVSESVTDLLHGQWDLGTVHVRLHHLIRRVEDVSCVT